MHEVITPAAEAPGPAWSEDFSYSYHWKIVDTLQREGYRLCTVSEAAEHLTDSAEGRLAIIRHDIDMSPAAAKAMAKLEAAQDIQATYFVIPNTPHYDIREPKAMALIQKIADYGHEIGLHYNPDTYARNHVADARVLEEEIASHADYLERIIERPVKAVSFHEPGNRQGWLRGPLTLGGLPNAYAAKFMDSGQGALYATDSSGVWKYGEPIQRIQTAGADVIQILTHAEWWSE